MWWSRLSVSDLSSVTKPSVRYCVRYRSYLQKFVELRVISWEWYCDSHTARTASKWNNAGICHCFRPICNRPQRRRPEICIPPHLFFFQLRRIENDTLFRVNKILAVSSTFADPFKQISMQELCTQSCLVFANFQKISVETAVFLLGAQMNFALLLVHWNFNILQVKNVVVMSLYHATDRRVGSFAVASKR
jgi:hypothetical protein